MKVKVKKWIMIKVKNKEGFYYDDSKKVDDGVAEFCAWGVDCRRLKNGVGTSSTAIIKRDDGTVENVRCNMIQFIS
jgi:hypothetical protein